MLGIMANHILSVCIFCFLCATHSPCASHASLNQKDVNNLKIETNNPPLIADLTRDKLKTRNLSNNSINLNIVNDVNRNKDNDLIGNNNNNNNNNNNSSDDKENMLQQIFIKYGNGESITMEGFEKLLKHLDGLQALAIKYDVKDEKLEELSKTVTCSTRKHLSASLQLELNSTKKITQSTIEAICPSILSSIISKDCIQDTIDIHNVPTETNYPKLREWLYSIGAVILISACGLLSLVIIPVMQKKFYKPLLQFLVALAVGTLAGDALLHLLPHAMNNGHSHEHGHEENHENMWKGFVAMLGLTLFFVMERFIPFAGKWWRNKQKNKTHSRVKVLNGQAIVNANDTQCREKYNSYSRCYRDIVDDPNTTFLETDETVNMTDKNHSKKMPDIDQVLWNMNEEYTDTDKESKGNEVKDKKESNQNMTDCLNDFNCTEMNIMLPPEDKGTDRGDGAITVILSEHGSNHHGHSHSHGHVHVAPQNYSSVAWMVIMGDGLHNFTDGIAIGAAFSGSLAGGFSTAVAVFCHELPHEVGDFAMLLKAGMSINQALCYNFLSSILCLMGNLFGMWLGNTEYASSWVFAVAAGTFLYIALVDMIPELSSAHEDEGDITQCFLHLSGLLLGVGIMTLIALYEHDLKNIFNDK